VNLTVEFEERTSHLQFHVMPDNSMRYNIIGTTDSLRHFIPVLNRKALSLCPSLTLK